MFMISYKLKEMKILFLSLFLIFILWNCENLTGSLDLAQKPVFFIYYIYDNIGPNSLKMCLASTDQSKQKILFSEQGNCGFMKWFNDGYSFLYSTFEWDSDTVYLKIYNLLDNSLETIWKSSTHYIHNASISPDNRSIVLTLANIGVASPCILAIINSDGTGFRNIKDLVAYRPIYASGNQIFFKSELSLIYSISPDGENLTRISADSIDAVGYYVIDRQRQQIAFTSWGPGIKLYLTDYAGSETRLIFDSSQDSLSQLYEAVDDPEFSPDGKKIAFTRLSDFITILNLADLHFNNYKVSERRNVYNPSWTPAGDYIIYCVHEEQMAKIYQLSLDDRKILKLIEFENFTDPIFELSPMYWMF